MLPGVSAGAIRQGGFDLFADAGWLYRLRGRHYTNDAR